MLKMNLLDPRQRDANRIHYLKDWPSSRSDLVAGSKHWMSLPLLLPLPSSEHHHALNHHRTSDIATLVKRMDGIEICGCKIGESIHLRMSKKLSGSRLLSISHVCAQAWQVRNALTVCVERFILLFLFFRRLTMYKAGGWRGEFEGCSSGKIQCLLQGTGKGSVRPL